jgi:hypothetical protein
LAEKEPPQTSEDLAIVLKELEQKTERLKQLYEQYFMGIERMEPMVARKEVQRTMLLLQQQYIRNTALRFKFNTMLQKWSLYVTYWNRIMREIENGTYVRHLQKAARHAEKRGAKLPSEMTHNLMFEQNEIADRVADVLREFEESATPATAPAKAVAPGVSRPPLPPGAKGTVPPPPPGAMRTPTPPQGVPIRATPPQGVPAVRTATPPGGVTIKVTPPQGTPVYTTPPQGVPTHKTPPQGAPTRPPQTVPGMSESELRALHRKYLAAKQASGDAAPVRYETLVASIVKQVPKVLERPGVKGVRFDVEMKDGKPVLKAIPTK